MNMPRHPFRPGVFTPQPFASQQIRGMNAKKQDGFLSNNMEFRSANGLAPFYNPFAPLYANGELGAAYIPNTYTLFQDSTLTTPVDSDGQYVGGMLDLSGNGFHMLQGAVASQMVFKVQDNLLYLEPDAIDDFMQTAITGAINQPFTMMGCAKFDNPLIGGDSIGNIFDSATRQIIGTDAAQFRVYSGVSLNGGVRVQGNTYVITGYINGVNSTNSIDNVLVASGDAGAVNYGTRLILGSDNSGLGQYLIGRFYGGFFINRALTASELTYFTSYLAALGGQ